MGCDPRPQGTGASSRCRRPLSRHATITNHLPDQGRTGEATRNTRAPPTKTHNTNKHKSTRRSPTTPKPNANSIWNPKLSQREQKPYPPRARDLPRKGESWTPRPGGGGWQAGTRSTKPKRANRTKEPMGERESAREQMCERAGACARPGIRKMKQKRLEKKRKQDT